MSLNCQAKAAATFVSLYRMGIIDKVKDADTFRSLYHGVGKPEPYESADVPAEVKMAEPKAGPETRPGMIIRHKKFGEGTIVSADASSLVIRFSDAEEKKLGRKWCEANCMFGL